MTIIAPVLSMLDQQLLHFPVQGVDTPCGGVQFRTSGHGTKVTHVLLHGIGSGSASWLAQLLAASASSTLKLLAWDAPGYGTSTPVQAQQPLAPDYAKHLWAWLDAAGVVDPITLVGHSLGALIAASATRLAPARVSRLVLLAPARGYGKASEKDREKKLSDRLEALASLGPQGMAEKRGAAMLSAAASAEQITFIQSIMSQINPAGYTQASHLLAGGDLETDLRQLRCPVTVASGHADTITPPEACQTVAEVARVAWTDLGKVGHACPLEAAESVNSLLGVTTTGNQP